MVDKQFEVFLQTVTIQDLKKIIKEYTQVKGLSKYRKADLDEAFTELLTEEQKKEALNKWMPIKIQENIERSINLLTKWRNAEFTLDSQANEYSVDLEWQGGEHDVCTIRLNNSQLSHECSCRVGERGGICVHLVGLTILLYLKGKIGLEQFPFKIQESWLGNILSIKNEILNTIADPSDADIDMNEYWLFIRGNKITAKWSGDYAGTKTVDIEEINKDAKIPITIDEWVVTKIVDKQLENLRKYGRVRDIITDKFGVIEKILTNKKQFNRLQAAFKRAAEKFELESYPESPEEIRDALRIGLIE